MPRALCTVTCDGVFLFYRTLARRSFSGDYGTSSSSFLPNRFRHHCYISWDEPGPTLPEAQAESAEPTELAALAAAEAAETQAESETPAEPARGRACGKCPFQTRSFLATYDRPERIDRDKPSKMLSWQIRPDLRTLYLRRPTERSDATDPAKLIFALLFSARTNNTISRMKRPMPILRKF